MFETESAEKVTIETQKKPLIICSFLGVFWNICSGSSQPVKAPSEEKVPPEAHKETFCDRNTCTTAAAPEAEKKVLLEKFEHLHAQGSIGASRKIHYGTEDHLGSTRMVLTDNGLGATVIKEALMYQPYGAVSDVDGIPAARLEPLRQKFTTKEFDEEGPDFGQIEFDIALDFALTHTDPTKPNRVEVYYADAPSSPEIIYVTIDPATNKGKVTATLNNATSRTIASIQFKLNDDAVTCNVENIAEITNPGSKLTIEQTFTDVSEFQTTVPKTFLNYSNESFYMAGIQAYYFGARFYDPELGVWYSTDPKEQFYNPYNYHTNPIMFIDPNGESMSPVSWLLPIAIGAASGTAAYVTSPDPAVREQWWKGTLLGGASGGITMAGNWMMGHVLPFPYVINGLLEPQIMGGSFYLLNNALGAKSSIDKEISLRGYVFGSTLSQAYVGLVGSVENPARWGHRREISEKLTAVHNEIRHGNDPMFSHKISLTWNLDEHRVGGLIANARYNISGHRNPGKSWPTVDENHGGFSNRASSWHDGKMGTIIFSQYYLSKFKISPAKLSASLSATPPYVSQSLPYIWYFSCHITKAIKKTFLQ